ncbi:hypothetical protein JCM1841_003189 [Sporobolomyces salmonicolor]
MSCGRPTQDEAGEDHMPPAVTPSSSCVRCGNPPKIVVRTTAWCHDCFLAAFTSRFRRGIDGARTVSKSGFDVYEGIKHNPRRKEQEGGSLSKVLLAFSGGASSRAMLELFEASYFKQLSDQADEPTADSKGKQRKKHSRHPPAFAECEVVYVDESGLPGHGEDHTEEIRRIVETTTPFTFVPLKLEDVFAPSSSPVFDTSLLSSSLPSSPLPSSSSSSLSALSQLHSLFTRNPALSSTSSTALRTALLSSLLRRTARQRGAEVLLLGDSGTRIGIKILAGMAQGRGFSAGEEVASEYVDRSEGAGCEVLVVRPLALSLAKEVVYYGKTKGLETVTVLNEETSVAGMNRLGGEGRKDVKKRGIEALVEDFVLSLESQFPSTVSTVVRTAHKLGLRAADAAIRSHGERGTETCALCGMPAQRDAEGWRRAITISDLQAARKALAPAAKFSTSGGEITEVPVSGRKAPYQPSKAHLLDESAPDSSAPLPPPASVSLPASTPPTNSIPLARHLCYACLLILQTAAPPSAATLKQPTTTTEMVLPPYVWEAVQGHEKRRLGAKGEEVVGTKETKGVEVLRKEVEGFLLE